MESPVSLCSSGDVWCCPPGSQQKAPGIRARLENTALSKEPVIPWHFQVAVLHKGCIMKVGAKKL